MEWVNVASFWVSFIMALIAISSVLISYTIYRSSTDPEIIVYAQPDFKRPSIINLIVHNIGKSPALNVNFSPTRPLPENAYGFDDALLPKEMTDGPLINGIPYIAPNQQFVITWGQYGGLNKYFGSSTIDVNISFERPTSLLRPHKYKTSKSRLDIRSWEKTDVSDHNWDKKISEELKDLNKSIKKIIKIVEHHEYKKEANKKMNMDKFKRRSLRRAT